MNNTLHLSACCKTDPGLHRAKNEDVCLTDPEHRYFLVADGMGGNAGGDVASGIFQRAVTRILGKDQTVLQQERLAQVHNCFSRANAEIIAQASGNPVLTGMGCTAELLTFHDDTFILGHVGDSRTYRFQEGELQQITKDHSLVQQQLDRGEISSTEAKKSKFKNVLLQAVGTSPELTADIISERVQPGTIFLLCTDGLHSMISVNEIQPVLAFDAPLELKAEMLVNMANDAGGKDNITVTLVEAT